MQWSIRYFARSAFACTIFLMVCGGCHPALPNAPSVPNEEKSFEQQKAPELPGLSEEYQSSQNETADTNDRLAHGDVLEVQSLQPLSFEKATAMVDHKGNIVLPLVGEIHVGGLSVAEAQQVISTQLARYEQEPRIHLHVLEAKSRVATILGAVVKPGVISLAGDLRISDLIAHAGGVAQTVTEDRTVLLADVESARIRRDGRILPVSIRLAMEGHPAHNIRVRRGDMLYMPPSLADRIVILGEVGKPRTMSARTGLRLTEAIADAGGLTHQADEGDVRIMRGGLSSTKVYRAKLNDVFKGKRPDVQLLPGDVVLVTRAGWAPLVDVLGQLLPSLTTGVLVGTAIAPKL